MRAWASSLPAALLLAACSFTPPAPAVTADAPPGGDGGADGPCADADGDTVCDADDQCAGHDDRLDGDGDGIPDGCDDWPCGLTKPPTPGGPIVSDSDGPGRRWGASSINIGDMRRVVADPGEEFDVRFTWGLYINCGGGQTVCRAQVEIGYGPTRAGCVFDGNVLDERLTGAFVNLRLTAPTTPAVYEIRLNAGRRPSCGGGQEPWYVGDPGPESTIGILCVRP